MKLTNKKGLPEAIVQAISNDPYSKDGADFTVTGLLTPPQISYLLAKHNAELTEDVADRMYALLGQSVHAILEQAAKSCPDLIVERRFFKDVGGVKVGGKIDLYDPRTKTLQDYKVVSVYKLMDGVPPEYEAQLNDCAHLLRVNGLPVERVEIVAIYRDWSKGQAERAREGDSYPTQQVDIFPARLWDDSECARHIATRVGVHQAARAGLPAPCTADERWEKPPVFAVMKKGNKSAVRGGLKDTKQEADLMAAQLGSAHYVQARPGKSVRCESFCPVRNFCPQFAAMKQGESGNGENE